MATVNKEWIENKIQKNWHKPKFREAYIKANRELTEETGIDRSHKIAEHDAIFETKRMAKTGETTK